MKNSWLSILSFIISVAAIFLSLRNDPITIKFDAAILVSVATIMSIPTAILLGWQILTALGMKKEIQDIRKDMERQYSATNERIEKFEKESNAKIEEVKQEKGFVKLSHSDIILDKNGGREYFMIESNTSWNIYVNNSDKVQHINNLSVYPLNGSGNATVTIEYGSVETCNYQQQASICIFYVSYGVKQTSVLTIHRKHI